MTWSIAVLAAGKSSRFGKEKIFAKLDGRAMIERAVSTAHELQIPVAVVISPRHLHMQSQLAYPSKFLVNSCADNGIGSSIAMAANWALASQADGLVLTLADMPLISSSRLFQLIALATQYGMSSCRYPDGRPGVPAAFTPHYLADLVHLSGDTGARELLSFGDPCSQLKCSALELSDVDTPMDLTRIVGESAGKVGFS